jgi:hypothetical protein
MDEIVKTVLSAPLATLLIVAGLVFLFVAVVGSVAGKIEPGGVGRIVSGVIGVILLATGLAFNLMSTRSEEYARKDAEVQRQRQAELEQQRQAESDRQRQARLKSQVQADLDRQRAEAERKRQAELERQRLADVEARRQAELERQRQELERQHEKKATPPSIAQAPSTATQSSTIPLLRTISSGREILKGSYTLDLDTGRQGVPSAEADIHWELVDERMREPVRYLNAFSGARFSYLGRVDFDHIPEQDFLTANYSATRLNGSASIANQLTEGTVILVRTKKGNYSKLKIEKYGIAAPGDLPQWPKSALLINWVTFGPKAASGNK